MNTKRRIKSKELLPRLVLLARKVGTEAWERVAEVPIENGDYVTARFEATEDCLMEFTAQYEPPSEPPIPLRWWTSGGMEDAPRRIHMRAGETATADGPASGRGALRAQRAPKRHTSKSN